MSRCRSCGGCRGFTAGRDHDAEGSDILNTIVFALPFIVILLTSYIIKNPTPRSAHRCGIDTHSLDYLSCAVLWFRLGKEG